MPTLASEITFNPEMVEIVDEGEHLLVRGNIPRNHEGHLDLKALESRLDTFGPHETTIISFLTEEREDETKLLYELLFTFEGSSLEMGTPYVHPEKGTWYFWQVRAHMTLSPPLSKWTPFEEIEKRVSSPAPLLEQVFLNRPLRFDRLIALIETLMETPSELRKIIYLHCRHGWNRTSAVVAGYLMKKYHLTAKQAYLLATAKSTIYKPEELKTFLVMYELHLQS